MDDKSSWKKMEMDSSDDYSSSRAWRFGNAFYCRWHKFYVDYYRFFSQKLNDAASSTRIGLDMQIDELAKVLWLSSTLFFIVGGYWLLRVLLLQNFANNFIHKLFFSVVFERSYHECNRWCGIHSTSQDCFAVCRFCLGHSVQ